MSKIIVSIILGALAASAIAASCPAANSGPFFLSTSQKVENPKSCSWYAQDTCCNASFDTSSLLAKFGSDASATCKDKINIMLCAACSPQSSVYLSTDSRSGGLQYKICKTYCETLYSACGDVKIQGETKPVRELFATSDLFCTSPLFILTNSTSPFTASGQCFNSAPGVRASLFGILSLVILTLAYLMH